MPNPALFGQPASFRDVRDLYGGLQKDGYFKDFGQIDFSKYAQTLSGDPSLFSAADSYSDLAFKSVPDFIDRQLEKTGLPQASGRFFEPIARRMGASEGVGQSVGESLPAGMVDLAPMLAGAAIGGPIGVVGGAGISALLSGMRAFKDTDSPTSAVTQGALTLALPGVAHVGGKLAASAASKLAPNLLKQGVAKGFTEYAGGQAAALSTETTADFIQSGQGFGEYFTNKDNLIAQALGELPFAIADIPRGIRGMSPKLQTQAKIQAENFRKSDHESRSATEALDKKIDEIESPPIISKPSAFQPAELELKLIHVVEELINDKNKVLAELENPNASQRYSENLDILKQAYEGGIQKLKTLDTEKLPKKRLLQLENDDIFTLSSKIKEKLKIDELSNNVQNFPEDQRYSKIYEKATELIPNIVEPNFTSAEHAQAMYQNLGGDSRVSPEAFAPIANGQTPIPETLYDFNKLLTNTALASNSIIPEINHLKLADLPLDIDSYKNFEDLATILIEQNYEEQTLEFPTTSDETVRAHIETSVLDDDLDINDAVSTAVRKIHNNHQHKKAAVSSPAPPQTFHEKAFEKPSIFVDQLHDAWLHLKNYSQSKGIYNTVFAGKELPSIDEIRHDNRKRQQAIYNAYVSRLNRALKGDIDHESNAALSLERGDLIPGSLDDTVKRIAFAEGLDTLGAQYLKDSLAKIQALIPATKLDFIGFIDNLTKGSGLEHLGLAQTTVDGMKRLFLGSLQRSKNIDPQMLGKIHSFVFGHELAHSVDHDFRQGRLQGKLGERYKEFSDWSETAEHQDVVDALSVFKERLPKEFRENYEVNQLLKNTTGEELRANIHALWAMLASEGGKDVAIAHTLLPRAVRRIQTELNTMARRLLRGVKKMLGMDFGVMEDVERFSKLFEDIQKESQKAEADIAEFSTIAHVDPERLLSMDIPLEGERGIVELMSPATIMQQVDGERVITGNVGDRVLGQLSFLTEKAAHLAARYPVLKGLFGAMAEHNSNFRGMKNRIMDEIVGKHGVNQKAYEGILQENNPKLNSFFGDMMRAQNDLNYVQDFTKMTPEMRTRWNKFSKEEQDLGKDQWERHVNGAKKKDEEVLDSERKVSHDVVAKIMTTNMEKSEWKKAKAWAQRIVDAHALAVDGEFGAEVPKAQLDEVALEMLKDGKKNAYISANAMAKKLMEGRAKFREYVKERPVVFNTRRTGKYALSWINEDGSRGRQRYPSKREMNSHKKWLRERNRTEINEDAVVKNGKIFDQDPESKSFFEQLDNDRFEYIDSLNLEHADKEQLKEMVQTTDEWRNAAMDNNNVRVKNLKPRQTNDGTEMLDMVDNFRVDVAMTSRMMNNRIMNASFNYQLTNPELASVPRALAQMKQNKVNYMEPDTKAGMLWTRAMFTYFLGFNLTSHLLELSQPVMSVIPQMIAGELGLIESVKMIKSAYGDVAKINLHMIKNRKSVESLHDWSQAGLKDGKEVGMLMEQLYDDGEINLGSYDEVTDTDMQSRLNAESVQQSGKMAKLGENLIKPITIYSQLSAKTYGAFTHVNTKLSGIVGWRMAKKKFPNEPSFVKDPRNPREQILNPVLYDAAKEFIGLTAFNKGRADRTTALFSGSGTFRTTGMGLETLRGFTNSMLSDLARFGQHGYSKRDLGLTDGQRKAARKALNVQLGASFLASGALGLPFVGAMIATLEEHSDLELNKGIREGMAAMFGEDNEMGGFLRDVALDGFANQMLDRAGVPIDVGSRLAIGGIIGTDSYRGFSQDALFGASGSVARKIVSGTEALVQGNLGQAAEDFAPQAWKKIINLARNEGEVIDRYGQKLMDANTKDLIALGVGFNPQKLKNARDTARIQARTREIQRRALTREYDKIADIAQSDPQKARQLLEKQELDSEGLHTAKSGAQRVAERLEEKTFAKDPRREATKASSVSERNYLNSSQSLDMAPTELDRTMFKDQVMKSLGQEVRRSPKEIAKMQLMDSLMSSQKTMTRAQASDASKSAGIKLPKLSQRLPLSPF